MSLFANAIQRGSRAAQPAASTVVIGTLYYVTDENLTERSTGSAWEDVSDGGAENKAYVKSNEAQLSERISDLIMVNADLTLTELADGSGDAVLLGVGSTVVKTDNTDWTDLTDSGETTLHTHPLLFTDQSLVDGEIVHTSDWERTLQEPLLYRTVSVPVTVTTMSGTVTLLADSSTYQFMDPADSARNIDTPTEFEGLNYVIMNIGDGGETLTVRDSGASTITTIANDAFATIIYAGGAWRVFS